MKRSRQSGNSHIKFRLAKSFRRGMTTSEKLLWSRLRRNQLLGLHFRRQHVIRGFIVDFYCHHARLVIEIDGEIHQSQIEADLDRDNILRSLGLTVRFPNVILENSLGITLQEIRRICLENIPGLQNNAVGDKVNK